MTEQALTKKTVDVYGSKMAYHERGHGAPVLLLHGNPTSSYLWRDVIPELEGRGRLIAPEPAERFPSAEAADLVEQGAANFHRQLVHGNLASEYGNEIRVWLEELD